MSNGIFGPYVKFTDKICCPSCNQTKLIRDLIMQNNQGSSPRWYVCSCKPDQPLIADPGDGRIQIFNELAHCLVSSNTSNQNKTMGISFMEGPSGLAGL